MILFKLGIVLLLACLNPLFLLLLPLALGGGEAAVAVTHAVEKGTGSESAGNGCGWLVFAALFAVFAFLVIAGLAVTMPEDCRTIVINQVMGRCP
jgi:TRAP-type mannitol/chloroaromatic compound transport system permease small subunit